jgi:hypothetical protein
MVALKKRSELWIISRAFKALNFRKSSNQKASIDMLVVNICRAIITLVKASALLESKPRIGIKIQLGANVN